jgi:purine-nucleoside phosphorylase
VTQESPPGPPDTLAAEGASLVRERCAIEPSLALVLGSGLGDAVAADVEAKYEFVFESLPGFPAASVPGHRNRLEIGSLYGVDAAIFRGRVHFYEGHGIQATTLIPRLAAALGARVLVVTNAAGGLDASMRPGELMLIEDHINFMGVNPLLGWTYPSGAPAFVQLSDVYDRRLLALAQEEAARSGVAVRRGVYVGLPGPSYETPAETRFLSLAGAHAVGMSTVPEAVAARALGMEVLGISCIGNVAGGSDDHEGVLAAARRAAGDLRAILSGVIPRMSGAGRPGGAGSPGESARPVRP